MARHQCLNCGEPFEGPEFMNYILKLRSKTVRCLRCQQDNFIVPKRGALYFILLLISIMVGLSVFLIINIPFIISTDRISFLFLALGGFFGLGAGRLIMNIFNWQTGFVSQDKKYKSASDYE